MSAAGWKHPCAGMYQRASTRKGVQWEAFGGTGTWNLIRWSSRWPHLSRHGTFRTLKAAGEYIDRHEGGA